jgi:hypothetical protein
MSTSIHDGSNEFEHPFKPIRKRTAKVDAVCLPKAQAQQHHVGHLMVVPQSLLAVYAIGAILLHRLRLEFGPRPLTPAYRLRP